jgi:hypothetical protein
MATQHRTKTIPGLRTDSPQSTPPSTRVEPTYPASPFVSLPPTHALCTLTHSHYVFERASAEETEETGESEDEGALGNALGPAPTGEAPTRGARTRRKRTPPGADLASLPPLTSPGTLKRNRSNMSFPPLPRGTVTTHTHTHTHTHTPQHTHTPGHREFKKHGKLELR